MTANLRRALGAGLAALIATAVVGGQGSPSEAIVPFRIHVPDAVLSDLKQRLARARFPEQMPGTGWEAGTNTDYLRELVAYWRTKYDWRAQERMLNQFPQFKTNIDGLDIHFIHQRSAVPGAKALLLLNGWPSSFVEYVKVIGPLVDPVAHGGRPEDAFNVVVPSLPGFGFSDKPREPGYDAGRIATTMKTLMARLGYTQYAAHGSDWGFGIATHLASQDAAHMNALHLLTCQGLPALTNLPGDRLGYVEIQSTRPHTLGHSLSDSPVGLASWIVEKWYAWSDHDGDVEKVYTKDDLLTNITVYWVTDTGTSSTRIYYENRHRDGRLLPGFLPGLLPEGKIGVPTGCALFNRQWDSRANRTSPDLAAARRNAETRYPVVHFASMPRGGHFAAMEQPALWIDDVRTFFRELGR